MTKPTFYITTPIYYPSASLHIGHAYTTVAADTIARYKKLRGFDVRFLTGTDEHGQKIERIAKAQGTTPIAYVDNIVAGIKSLWDTLDIQYDDFIRTTEDRHKKCVQDIFTKIYEKGDIYKAEYEGWYCTPCETFWTERQLTEGNCPDCNRPVEVVKEESYFFRMSKYADRLLAHIEDNPDFIQPVSRRNEMISFIKSGLEDLCVSRTTFDWGVPVPIDEKHVIYVWFDALSNYISALGYGQEDDSLYQKYWPADLHLVGKDIIRFHTIIWPIILMAADLPLPKRVLGHGWMLLDGGKISKSKGNVVDPVILAGKYGVDAIRYYLVRELPFGSDGYYSEDILVQRINSDLANDLGNLVSRTVAMIEKYHGGIVQEPTAPGDFDDDLKGLAVQTIDEYQRFMDNYQLSNAIGVLWKFISRTNKYIDETTPWILAKDPGQSARLGTVLYNLAEAIRLVTVALGPALSNLPAKVWQQLGIADQPEVHTWASIEQWGGLPVGVRVQKGDALFPRIDLAKEETINMTTDNQPANKETKPAQAKITSEAKVEEKEQYITIDEFAKVDLRVAEIMAAERVENTDKLMKLEVALGEERRTVVSGIAKHYTPEELVGKKVVLVANLKPTKLRGIMSQGMILAASEGELLEVLSVTKDIGSGNKVK